MQPERDVREGRVTTSVPNDVSNGNDAYELPFAVVDVVGQVYFTCAIQNVDLVKTKHLNIVNKSFEWQASNLLTSRLLYYRIVQIEIHEYVASTHKRFPSTIGART